MKTSAELLQERADQLAAYKALVDTATAQKRDITDDDQKQLDAIHTRVAEIGEARAYGGNGELAKAEEREAMLKAAARTQLTTAPNIVKEVDRGGEIAAKNKAQRSYSVLRAVQQRYAQKNLTGLEAEMDQEARREAGAIDGITIPGRSVSMPAFFVQKSTEESRAFNVTTATEGPEAIATELHSKLIGAFTPKILADKMGATVLTGLTGDMTFTVDEDNIEAQWAATEFATASEQQSTLGLVTMAPKRLTAKTYFGMQIEHQTSWSMEQFVRNKLVLGTQIALDKTIYNGAGASGVPKGILNHAVQTVDMGSGGGAVTYDKMIELWTKLAEADADDATLATVTTPGVKAALMTTLFDSGSGVVLWDKFKDTRFFVTNNMPSDLADGGPSTLHALIYGNWADLYLGQWGGLSLLVDPYDKGDEAQIKITTHSWWDVLVARPNSFAVMKDIDVS